MLVSNGLKQFGRRPPETTGASVVASTIVTVLLFACAFAAMRTVGRRDSPADHTPDRPVVVSLVPPAPVVPPRRVITQPAPIRSPAPAPPATRTPITEPPAPPRDTATARAPVSSAPAAPSSRAPATIPIGIAPVPSTLADTAMSTRGGAPASGAAVSLGDQTANTARFRDSIANARMRDQARAWLRREATGREKQEIETSQRAAAKLAERTTTSGNSRDVHIPQGKGVNGVGAVGGGMGFAAPLFSSGPSAAQRRRNDSLDAEYQLRLRRLQDRVIARRDSVRLDSLRRDALARRPRAPVPLPDLTPRSPILGPRSRVASRLVQRPLQLPAP